MKQRLKYEIVNAIIIDVELRFNKERDNVIFNIVFKTAKQEYSYDFSCVDAVRLFSILDCDNNKQLIEKPCVLLLEDDEPIDVGCFLYQYGNLSHGMKSSDFWLYYNYKGIHEAVTGEEYIGF